MQKDVKNAPNMRLDDTKVMPSHLEQSERHYVWRFEGQRRFSLITTKE